MSPSSTYLKDSGLRDSNPEGCGERIKLPKPDPKNITVLTHNLPNVPILPWNHYDSPAANPSTDPSSSPEAQP